MKKQLLLNLTFLLFTIGIFAQSSGTFSGSINDVITHTFVSSGNGQYMFTGNYTNTTSGWVTISAFIGQHNNYNLGGNFATNGTLNFETECVQVGQTIGLRLEASGTHNYSINYQFIPTTYSTGDTEPNDTFAQSISTTENTNYEGWFNGPNGPNNDNTDWYRFTSPRDGDLIISVKNGDEYDGSGGVSQTLYNSSNLNQIIFASNTVQNGETTKYTYENFNFNGQEFGIRLQSGCESYQISWTVDDSSLNIENYNLDNSIKLYPNPVLDNLSVTINNNLNLEKVEIIGITGQLIKKTNIINNSISTQNLKSGIYFVKIHSDKGIITKKIIKSE